MIFFCSDVTAVIYFLIRSVHNLPLCLGLFQTCLVSCIGYLVGKEDIINLFVVYLIIQRAGMTQCSNRDGRGSICGWGQRVLSTPVSSPALGANQPFLPWVPGALSPGIKWLGHEDDKLGSL
jgi:hypothetical protein